MRRRFSPALGWSLAVFAFAVVAFSPALNNDFVFDDVAQVRDLPPAAGLADWLGSVADPWWPPEKNKNVWRPVTRLAILAEKAVAGTNSGEEKAAPRTYRLASLVLHGAGSVLVLLLARCLGFGWAGAGAAALVVAIHPVRSEAVHQIVGQAEILASVFMIAGLIAYVRSRAAGKSVLACAAIQSVFYALAVGSKEHAIIYPALVALVALSEWRIFRIQRDRASGGPASGEGQGREMDGRAQLKSLAIVIVSLAAVLGLYLSARTAVTGGLIESPSSVPSYENEMARMLPADRLPAVLGIFGYALTKAVLPVGLSPDYSAESLPLADAARWPLTYLGALALLALAIFAAVDYRRRGRGRLLILGGLLAYGLTSNLIFTIGVSVAERLWYFPLVAIGLAAGWIWGRWFERVRLKTEGGGSFFINPPTLTLGLIAVLLLAATWSYAPAWRTELDRSLRIVERFPLSWRGNHNLSTELYLRGDYEEGLAYGRTATGVAPNEALSWDYVGLNAMHLPGHDEEAESAFRTALELNPGLDLGYQHLANHLWNQGRRDEALPYYERYLESDPDDREGVLARIEIIRSGAAPPD